MNRFSYITGYLPEVTTRETQFKKTQKRLIYTACVTIIIIIILALIKNSTSAQVKNELFKTTSLSKSIYASESKNKPIWLLIDLSNSIPLLLSSKLEGITKPSEEISSFVKKINSTQKNVFTANKKISTKNMSPEKLETLYREDLERLLNRAFANNK